MRFRAWPPAGRGEKRTIAFGGIPMRRLALSRSLLLLAASSALAAGVSHAAPASSPEPADEPRATMHQIFAALLEVLPTSLDEERFADPATRAAIQAQLDLLTASAVQLEAHAEGRDVGFRFLSRSLSADLEETRHRYERGRYEEARYFLLESTRNCIACHSRLPAAREFPLGEKLTEQIDVEAMAPHERAQIFVTTRRFDDALSTWEALFEDPAMSPAQLDVGGYIVDYLTISVRVKGDLERPQKALSKLAARPDTPRYLKHHLEGWTRQLASLKPQMGAENGLEQARKLIERPPTAGGLPTGREQVVADLVASSLLNRYIAAAPEPNASVAEALYLLGLTGYRSIDDYWVPQTEFNLEAAIRLDPKGPFAAPAYGLLEEYVVLGYGGASGKHLPADVWARLAELRRLIDGEAAPPPDEMDGEMPGTSS